MSVTLTYSSQSDFEIEMADIAQAKAARRVLSNLRDELRPVNKYGEPTKADEWWYEKFWELCSEEGIDGWEI